MAAITRWEPRRDLAGLSAEFDRLLRQLFPAREEDGVTIASGWSPMVDIEETDDAFVMHVEVPGIDPKDIEVDLDDDVLTIKGERRFYEEKEAEGFRRVERSFGRFRRSIRLPQRVDPDAIVATLGDGILKVLVPKAEETKTRRIEVGTTTI